MELKYLRELVVLAEKENFSDAADVLYITQSTLSKHIKHIETELGVSLFDRTSRKVKINDFGLAYIPIARQIIETHDKFSDVLQLRLHTDRDTLTLGSIRSMAHYHITDIIANYKKKYPKFIIKTIHSEFEGKSVGTHLLKDLLRQKKCDLAFIRLDSQIDEDLIKIPYINDTLVAVLPTNHPYAKRKLIPLKMIADNRFLFAEEGSSLYKLCIKVCQESGFEPKVVFTDPKPEDLIELVQNGTGIALMLRQLAIYSSNPNITILDITPTASAQFFLCYLKGTKLSDTAKYFIECTNSFIESHKFF
jgi:LysR family transcriptional activator of glutamate synthase operon